MINYRLDLCYCGKQFSGSQKQPEQRTVEGEFEKAIYALFQKSYTYILSGRTDTGVHAEQQVVSIKLPEKYELDEIKNALNSFLPKDLYIVDISKVPDSFNARYSATSRTYNYLFSTTKPPVYLEDRIVYVPNLNTDISIQNISNIFLGTHNFNAFRNTGSYQTKPVRTIYEIKHSYETQTIIYPDYPFNYHCLRIRANGFLYRMVRNIVGVIFEMIRGKVSFQDVEEMLKTGKKLIHYTTASAHGLSLVKVDYENNQ